MVGAVRDTKVRHVDVFQAENRHRGDTDTAAHVRRDAPDGGKIDIGVGQADPALDVGGIFVGARQERAVGISAGDAVRTGAARIAVLGAEQRLAPIFAGGIEAQPRVPLIADAIPKNGVLLMSS
jgi:hypothetical protein